MMTFDQFIAGFEGRYTQKELDLMRSAWDIASGALSENDAYLVKLMTDVVKIKQEREYLEEYLEVYMVKVREWEYFKDNTYMSASFFQRKLRIGYSTAVKVRSQANKERGINDVSNESTL